MRYLWIAVMLVYTGLLSGQELNCAVRLNAQKQQLVPPQVYESLEQTINEFMNNTKWTDDVFETEERINCNIVLTIQEELSETSFRADLAISSSRPVYGSDYQTPLLNHIDKGIVINYEQFQPLIFSQNTYNDNLSSVLSFYAYIMLGLDYDSFSLYGGEPYFQTAQDILNNVPIPSPVGDPGWESSRSDRNRFWIIENLLSPRVRPMRQAFYEYHRHGLDRMAEDAAAGRAVIAEALPALGKVNQRYPNAVILQMFANAKSSEIIEIFKVGSTTERREVASVMSRVDPPNASKYRQIR